MEQRERLSLLMEAHFTSVWGYLYALTRSSATADELTRRTFAIALLSLDEGAPTNEVRLWLHAFARNQWAQRANEQVEYVVLSGAEPDVATDATPLWQHLFRLEPPIREVVVLHGLSHLPIEDVARVTRQSVWRVRSRLVCLKQPLPTDNAPTRQLTDEDRRVAWREVSQVTATTWRPRAPRLRFAFLRRWPLWSAAALIVAGGWFETQHALLHHTSAAVKFPLYVISVAPDSVAHTPLDTTSFRRTVALYLLEHNINISSQTVTSEAGSNANGKPSAPSFHTVSGLAVRWSSTDFARYGYALVSYQLDGKPRVANIFAIRTSSGWTVSGVDAYPQVTSDNLSSFALYPDVWTASLLQSGRKIAFVFISGLVIDPVITRVTITTANGQREATQVTHGVFGFEVTDLTGHLIRNTVYKIKAYNQQGKLVYAN